jgi:hypothetical protein
MKYALNALPETFINMLQVIYVLSFLRYALISSTPVRAWSHSVVLKSI